MLSCNGIVLNYAFVLYNKSISKINIVQNIASELPVPPVMSYFLCDCWYVSEKIISTFVERGFHTIGALKTNRMLYPFGIRKKLSEFAALLSVTHADGSKQIINENGVIGVSSTRFTSDTTIYAYWVDDIGPEKDSTYLTVTNTDDKDYVYAKATKSSVSPVSLRLSCTPGTLPQIAWNTYRLNNDVQ